MDEETVKKDLERRYLELSKRYNTQKNSLGLVKDASIPNEEGTIVSRCTKQELWHIVKGRHLNRKFTEYSFAAHYFHVETQDQVKSV